MAGDTLSQSEIDELLSALSTGIVSAEDIKSEEQEKKIKLYNFKRPDKFSKDQIRTLYMIHENFARLLNTYLSAHLRAFVNVDVGSVDQLTYEEVIRSSSNPTVLCVFKMTPLPGNAIIEVSPSLAFAIIDRLAGGSGQGFSKVRALTDIEETIVARIMNKALDSLREAWRHVVEVTPKIDVIETNPQFTQIVHPSDMVVLINLKAKIMQTEGMITLCIPYLVLEPIMSKLTTTFWVSSGVTKKIDDNNNVVIRHKIERSLIPLSVVLGRTKVTVAELLNLNQGDVLCLDKKYSDDLSLMVGNSSKFRCRPGLAGKKVAVQITEVVREGDIYNG